MNRKTLLAAMAIAIPMLITGCTSNPGVGGGIQITAAPPADMEVNLSASIVATAGGGLTAAGVDWSCTPVGACGTFAPPHTNSGGATVYTAPNVAGPVSIVATSTKNPVKTQMAPVTITAVATAPNITGTYTYFANGVEKNKNMPNDVAGSIVINGATGMVTGGEQDFFNTFTGDIFPADPITGGTITVGADGRGTLTLTPTSAPAEIFSITVVNNHHILITQFNDAATASGSLDLQTAPTSIPTGGNAFALFDPTDIFAFGGVFTSNGITTIPTGEADDDSFGTADFDFVINGSFTAPDAAGRGTITLNNPNFGPFTLAYYVVGPEAFRLIEFDGAGFSTGSMFGQGAGVFSGASLGSKFVFGQSGIEGIAFGVYAAAGQFSGNGTTAFSSGVADVNLGDGSSKKAADLTTGTTYSVKANGYGAIALTGATTDGLANFGVYLIDPAINVADPNSAAGGGGAVMLDLDTDNIGVGIVAPKAANPTFTGNYALSQDGAFQTDAPAFSWYGLLGQVTSDGTSKFAGLADFNQVSYSQTAGVTVSATYAADGANPGRSTAMVTIGAAAPSPITAYQASSALLLHVDTDTSTNGVDDFGTIGLGVLEKQQ
jgi:hypothetical protein